MHCVKPNMLSSIFDYLWRKYCCTLYYREFDCWTSVHLKCPDLIKSAILIKSATCQHKRWRNNSVRPTQSYVRPLTPVLTSLLSQTGCVILLQSPRTSFLDIWRWILKTIRDLTLEEIHSFFQELYLRDMQDKPILGLYTRKRK